MPPQMAAFHMSFSLFVISVELYSNGFYVMLPCPTTKPIDDEDLVIIASLEYCLHAQALNLTMSLQCPQLPIHCSLVMYRHRKQTRTRIIRESSSYQRISINYHVA